MKTKILYWNWRSPYAATGSPDIIRKLLLHSDHEVYYVYGKKEAFPVSFELEGKQLCLNFLDYLKYIPNQRLNLFVLRWFKIPILTAIGLFVTWKFKPKAIFTIYSKPDYILSALNISKISGIPIYYYCHDPLIERYKYSFRTLQKFVESTEAKVMRYGNIIALYDSLKLLYQEKYGIEVKVLPHISSFTVKAKDKDQRKNGTFTIGFSGSIYFNNIDLMTKLVSLVKRDQSIQLNLWGLIPSEVRKRIGVENDERIQFKYETDYEALINQISKCDMLYLPLSFEEIDNRPREVLKYVLPTKAIDYLNTGLPILVHCPEDFELSQFFKKHSIGYILNSEDESDLKKAIENIKNGAYKQSSEKTNNALKIFDKTENIRYFNQLLNSKWAKG